MPKVWLREGEVVRLEGDITTDTPVTVDASLYVIICYTSPRVVGAFLGPYTQDQAYKTRAELTCEHTIHRLTTNLPPWVCQSYG